MATQTALKEHGKMVMRLARKRPAECATPGHPDKICDQIADAILDAALKQDPDSRVAMEVHGKSWVIGVNGELTAKAELNIAEIARETLRWIGYSDTFGIVVNVTKQSPNINDHVSKTDHMQQGAGDQGIMIGYATSETPTFMPGPMAVARSLVNRLVEVRTDGILPWVCPDGKSQVIMDGDKVCHITIAAHHHGGIPLETVRAEILKHVIRYILPDVKLNPERDIVVNGGGCFEIGGFVADAGTTGRKIVVDQFGPEVPVGGGAFSGKDPTKVDRSAAYFARFVAKSIVASGLANRALVTLAYAIGCPDAFCVSLQTDLEEEKEIALERYIQECFDFRPAAMIERLGLQRPNGWTYRETAAFGHYGNSKFPWEQNILI